MTGPETLGVVSNHWVPGMIGPSEKNWNGNSYWARTAVLLEHCSGPQQDDAYTDLRNPKHLCFPRETQIGLKA